LKIQKLELNLATTTLKQDKDLFNTTINITALQEMYERYFCRNQRLPKIENQKPLNVIPSKRNKNHLSN
jgi:hypothetical protein